MILPPRREIQNVVRRALDEDLGGGDVTTAALFPESIPARGVVIAHQPMVVAGLEAARQVFTELDSSLRSVIHREDGSRVTSGTVVFSVEGDARTILMGERVALNLLQHLSGIATLTARFREALRGYRTRVLDTRKTLPGLRALEKWAVGLGGGSNHRVSLADGTMIKDNHITLLRAQGITLTAACRLARERGPHGHRIVVETDTLSDVREAVQGGADVVLLDNMSPQMVRKAVEWIKGRAVVEVSGGITLANVVEMAQAGADAVSVGALTHSAPAADLGLQLCPVVARRPKRRRKRT